MKNVSKFGPAPSIDEHAFIPPTRAHAFVLETALVASGCSRARAGTIVMALIRLGETGHDGMIPPERSRYRRDLRKLGQPPWQGGDGTNTWAHRSGQLSPLNILKGDGRNLAYGTVFDLAEAA